MSSRKKKDTSSATSTTSSVVRMPTATDAAVLAAGQRAQEAARKRTGRASTILSDALRSMTGSSGKLGA